MAIFPKPGEDPVWDEDAENLGKIHNLRVHINSKDEEITKLKLQVESLTRNFDIERQLNRRLRYKIAQLERKLNHDPQ